jgi:hypothetical protein
MPRPEPLDEIQNGKTESSPDEKPRFSRRSWESCCACRIIVPSQHPYLRDRLPAEALSAKRLYLANIYNRARPAEALADGACIPKALRPATFDQDRHDRGCARATTTARN